MKPKESIMGLLTGYRAWQQGGPRAGGGEVTLFDYAGLIADLDSFFAFAALFMPDLVIHEGRRFLASGFSIGTYQQWVERGTEPREIQRVMNHIHVRTIIQHQNLDDDAALEVARILATVWRRTLGPGGVDVEEVGDTAHDAAVTFSEEVDQ